MLTRINSFVALILIACASCVSPPKGGGPVHKGVTPSTFLDVSPDSYVWVTQVKNQDGHYVLIYSQDKKRGVVLDVDKESKGDLSQVRNIGFGTDAGDGGWNLYNKDKNGLVYESQGGEWTLRNFAALLAEGLKQKQQRIPFKQVNRLAAEF